MLFQLLFGLASTAQITAVPSPKLSVRENDGQILNSSYIHPYFTQSRENINSYIDYSMRSIAIGTDHKYGQFVDGAPLFFWQSQNGWTAVARWERQQNSRGLFLEVLSAQNALARAPGDGFQQWGAPLVNDFNDDAGWAAMANIEAYEAYGNQIFLDRAIDVWEFISSHGFIDENILQKGYYEGVKYPNNTLQPECNGKTMYGGTGRTEVSSEGIQEAAMDPDVNAVSTGNYALLGAELCRVTGDWKYCDRAYENAWWLDRHMVTPENGLIWDHLNGTSCALANWTFTYNIGLYFGLYAELGHLTNNETATQIAEKTIVAALNADQWNTPGGILKEGAGEAGVGDDVIGFKAIMIRYLHKSYYWIKDESIKAAIVQYINIQYYALTTFASDSINIPIRYGRNWAGPAFNVSTEHAQLAALDVLNGLELNSDSAFPSSSDASGPVMSL